MAVTEAPPFSAAAERNKEPILAVLRRVLPVTGLVVEIASGTGQHVIHFAASMPALTWQPTDAEPALRATLPAAVAAAGLENVIGPLQLDVTATPWPISAADAIVCINMVHISPWAATLALFDGASSLLSPGDPLYLYGPYRRGDQHTAPSNEAFDDSLRARDPAWGIRDLEDVVSAAEGAGFALEEVVPMPANNFSVIFRKME
jgi:hypothetical protein